MKNKWLYRQMISFLPVFFVFTVVIGLLFYLSVGELTKRSIANANAALASYVVKMVDSNLQEVEGNLAKELITNPVFRYYGTAADSDFPNLYSKEIVNKLTEFTEVSPFIDNAYLVWNKDGTVLTPRYKVPLDQFADQEFIMNLRQNRLPVNWTNLRDYKDTYQDGPSYKVISLVKPVPFENSQGILVINIRISTIAKFLNGLTKTEFSKVELITQDGQLIYGQRRGNGSEMLSTSYSAEEVSSYTQWKISVGTANEGMLETAIVFTYVSIATGIVLTILGMGWIIHVVRRNYAPIQSINDKINAYFLNKHMYHHGDRGKDELTFLETALDRIIDQSLLFEKQHEENMNLRRQHQFRQLMNGDSQADLEDLKLEWQRQGLQFENVSLFVSIIEIDNQQEFITKYSQRDRALFKYLLQNVINEISAEAGICQWSEWLDPMQLGIIFQCTDTEGQEQVIRLCERNIEWLKQNVAFTVTIGVGSCCEQMDEIPQSYADAQESLKYKSSMGNERIIGIWDITGRKQGEILPYLNTVRTISQLYRLDDPSWHNHFEQLRTHLTTHLFTYDHIKSMMEYLIYHLNEEISQFSSDIREYWSKEAAPKLEWMLSSNHSAQGMLNGMYEGLTDSEQAIRALKKRKHNHKLIRGLQTYIEQNYGNPDLSLMVLSETVQVNAKYLSLLFKEEFGEKFIDYVTKVRIENAKSLLLETTAPVQDIAEKVGYTHSISFIRVFKKYVGQTPGDYRKNKG
jgi:two-component system response regulator YesN